MYLGGEIMAELCLDCWNKIHRKNFYKWDVKLTWRKDLCEECGQWKRVVLREKTILDDRFILLQLIFLVFEEIVQLLCYPIRCFQRKRHFEQKRRE